MANMTLLQKEIKTLVLYNAKQFSQTISHLDNLSKTNFVTGKVHCKNLVNNTF